MRSRNQQRLYGRFVSQSEIDLRRAVQEQLREDIAAAEADAAPSLPEAIGLWATLAEPLPSRAEFPMLALILTCLLFATITQLTVF